LGIVRIANIASGLIAAVGLAIGSADAANAGPPLILQQTIALENVSGRIDHMAVDVAGSCSESRRITVSWGFRSMKPASRRAFV
jgi:hypothetical protein